MEERRKKDPREKIGVQVLVELTHETWRRFKTKDLSLGGMFVTGLFVQPGTLFEFIFIENRTPSYGTARACWVNNEGTGCKFFSVNEKHLKLLLRRD